MVYIRTRKFCCCLPVRFGVFIMTVFGTIVGGLVCIAGWLAVSHFNQSTPLSHQDEIALYIQTIMYTLLAVVSAFGFIGAVIRSPTLVSLYSSLLIGHFVFNLIIGIFSIYSLFHQNASDLSTKCDDLAADDIGNQLCGNGMTVVKGLMIAFLVLIWLIQLYGIIIVSNYVDQLDEEAAAGYLEKSAYPPRPRSWSNRQRPPPLPITTYGDWEHHANAPYAFRQQGSAWEAGTAAGGGQGSTVPNYGATGIGGGTAAPTAGMAGRMV